MGDLAYAALEGVRGELHDEPAAFQPRAVLIALDLNSGDTVAVTVGLMKPAPKRSDDLIFGDSASSEVDPGYRVRAGPRSMSRGPNSVPVSSLQDRNSRFRRLTPQARATYERIREIRKELGAFDFDMVQALREIRNDE